MAPDGMARGIDRRVFTRGVAIVAIVLASAATAVSLIAPTLISKTELRAATVDRMRAAMGSEVTARNVKLTVWPRPAIVLEGLQGEGVDLATARARLSVSALLTGRAVPTRLLLSDGRLVPPAGDAAETKGLFDGLKLDRVDLERIALNVGGETIAVEDARIETVRGAFAADLKGAWNGRLVDGRLTLASLKNLATGTAATMRLTSPDMSMSFEGRIGASGPRTGELSIEGRSLSVFLTWLKQPHGTVTDAPFALSGRTGATAWGWELREADFTLGRTRGEGSLGLVRAPRMRLTGTLALDAIGTDLARLQGAASMLAPGFDADLRFSTPRLMLGPATLTGTAATLRANETEMKFEVSDASYLGGRATGTLRLPRGQAGTAAANLKVRLADIAMDDLPVAFPKAMPRLQGQAEITADATIVDGRADQIDARLSLRKGRVERLDLAAIARLGQDLVAGDVLNGETAFDTLTVDLVSIPDLLTIDDARLAGPGLAARLSGRIDVPRGVPALRGEVAAVNVSANADDDGLALAPRATTFFIGGTLAAPLVVPVEPR